MSTAKHYFSSTHTLLYSFLFSLPLFFIYEALILISQPNADQLVRINVDVWMKTLFTAFGVNAVSFSLLLVLVFGVFILYRERSQFKKLRLKYFPILICESLLYGIIVAYISSYLTYLILNVSVNEPLEQLSYLQKLALSLGAGLYEELFFRVFLVSLFLYVFNKLFSNKQWASFIAASVLSAVLFSAVHYMGSMGDYFTLDSFVFRFLFGLILNGIYVTRGFGVAAWTHALYDVIVVTFF